ncbi:nitrilase-related carbon-nitrogen hydrolase [Curtobacterium flaccumfaciens]|nr:nitrilase-related carbon-nitrogen hydrolase [Curtobacterium flaccumfaciens]
MDGGRLAGFLRQEAARAVRRVRAGPLVLLEARALAHRAAPTRLHAGTKPNVLSVAGVRAGIAICFDIVDDGLTTDMARGGAQVILAQTNNADFDGTDENLQQLEIARMRAIETGRSLVNISTVGASQVIDPSGRTIDRVPAYTATSMITDVPLGTSTTPATVASGSLVLVLALGGLLTLLACAPWSRRSRSLRRAPRRS